MRKLLLGVALMLGAAGGLLAWDRGAADALAAGVMALAVGALALFQLTPSSQKDVGLRPEERAARTQTPPTQQVRTSNGPRADGPFRSSNRAGQAPKRERPAAEQDALTKLSGNLRTIAGQRGGVTERSSADDLYLDIFLVSSGKNQVAVIKVLRKHLDLGLNEAKDLAEKAKDGQRPAIALQMPTDRARYIATAVAKAGGRVELR